MKITTDQALSFLNCYDTIKNSSFSFQTSYKLSKLFNSIQEEYKFFQNKYQELINMYAEYDENGKYVLTEDKTRVKLKADKLDECQAKMNELAQLELEIIDVDFKVEDFEQCILTPTQIEGIVQFIK